jgi:hypothetical protein
MLRPGEDLIQFIWKNRLLKPGNMATTRGSSLKVIRPGDLNTDSGPDFFNGHIEIDGVSLAGNIEIHVRTSDWTRHGHGQDAAYDNIILHVVYQHDHELLQNLSHGVEVLELKKYIDPEVLERYSNLASSAAELPCAAQIASVDDIHIVSWLMRMRVERLQYKTRKIELLFNECRGDYARVMYILLLSNFGFRINSIPFELIARHLPLQILLRHRDQVQQLEALLLGTAGMLEEQLSDPYLNSLQNEYMFLRSKYKLFPLEKSIFKFSRLRPANFPALRLAQFAALVHRDARLLLYPLDEENVNLIKRGLIADLTPYWKDHYTTGGNKAGKQLRLGDDSAENIIVNTIAPFFFFYGKKSSSEKHKEAALTLLESCAPENNLKTRAFRSKHYLFKNAGDSQGLINLYDNYCCRKKCLTCGIGMRLLSSGSRDKTGDATVKEPGFLYF